MAKMSLPKIKLDQEPSLREKVIFGAALLVIFFLFLNTFWTPASEGMSLLRLEQKSLKVQAEAMAKLIETARAQMVVTAPKTEEAPVVDDRVRRIIERRVRDVAEEINSTVDLLGGRRLAKRVKVKKVDVGDRIDMQRYTVVPITLSLQGPYTGVQGFMEAVEALERPVVIRSFEMALDKETPGELAAVLNVELYLPKR